MVYPDMEVEMKTRNRQQQEIDWLNEKVQLLERIIELEKQLRVLQPQPIYIPYQPYVPTEPKPWNPYNPTIIYGDTTAQTMMINDQCQTYLS
jgi:hypothetical protein